MKKIILFDIDHTLLNTDILRKKITSRLINISGKDKEVFLKLEIKYTFSLSSSSNFDPDKYTNLLARYLKVNKSLLLKGFYENPIVYKKSLYPETSTTLRVLSERYSLGIYSEEVESFQKIKIKDSKIYKYLDSNLVFIFRRKLDLLNLAKLPIGSFIVNDSLGVLNHIQETGKFFTIWINRRSTKIELPLETVKNLSELKSAIKQFLN